MKKLSILLIFLVIACKGEKEENKSTPTLNKERSAFSSIEIENILEDDSLSIRAIEIMGGNLAFAGNNGSYGLYDPSRKNWKTGNQQYDTLTPEFRAVGSTANDFFMLSVGNPALLYKTGDTGQMELVYKEEHEKVFYDALAFWNNQEGIAIGDPTDDCMSIIITRNGGNSWTKLNCKDLPPAKEGEAAFAASNSNIAVQGNMTWVLTGGMSSRILYSPDKGKSWEAIEIPLAQGTPTGGGYSMDFYDSNIGFIIGGDYTKPEGNKGNKAVTTDGGKTWTLVAEGQEPGYKSSVRYVPGSGGKELVATGFTGIHYSNDKGRSWNKLSDEGFYTLRFINDSVAYAAGKGRISKLKFR